MQKKYYGVNTETHKKCNICQELKNRSEFHNDSSRKDGTASYCKICLLEKNSKWQKENPEKWNKSLAERIWYRRQRTYGISKEEYMSIIEGQEYKCAICKEQINTSAAVDHCHNTQKIRGILCRECNAGIGLLKDDQSILLNAIEYLKNRG
jgi:DNA-directed RNA polymerase subunit RPC12/RpoP